MDNPKPKSKNSLVSSKLISTPQRKALKKSQTLSSIPTEETKNPSLARSSTMKSHSILHPSLLTLGKQIGSGKSASVFASSLGSRKFAVKVIPKEYKKYGKNEAEVLNMIKHENIVKFYKKFDKLEEVWLVFELIEGQDLFSFIRKRRPSINFIISLTKQLINALQEIHKAGVVYRDLKPENIMIINGEKVKIVDFGLAKMIKDEKTNTICGSPQYMAPEVVKGEMYDYSIDFWSLGVLVYECFVGRTPFEGNSFKEISENVIGGDIEFAVIHHMWARDFIRKLLDRDPEMRLGQRNGKNIDILSHPFLNFEEKV